MGKGKAKEKSSLIPVGDRMLETSGAPICTCGHDLPRAADGHKADGWTEQDIRMYNELLSERAKLEKEKNELEQKTVRYQAERALLNPDAAAFHDLFKLGIGGEYKFTGNAACCLDFSNSSSNMEKPARSDRLCHHEVCGRARKQGISLMEMDAIRYYQSRITLEKSERMRSALRKQRDVELARAKKEDEEELASRERKLLPNSNWLSSEKKPSHAHKVETSGLSLSNGFRPDDSVPVPKLNAMLEAAKESELVAKRIWSRLDKIKHDVNVGKINHSDLRMKLDRANKEMAGAERTDTLFKEMLSATSACQEKLLASLCAATDLSQTMNESLAGPARDALSQALGVIQGFFSATSPDLKTTLSQDRFPTPRLAQELSDGSKKTSRRAHTARITRPPSCVHITHIHHPRPNTSCLRARKSSKDNCWLSQRAFSIFVECPSCRPQQTKPLIARLRVSRIALVINWRVMLRLPYCYVRRTTGLA